MDSDKIKSEKKKKGGQQLREKKKKKKKRNSGRLCFTARNHAKWGVHRLKVGLATIRNVKRKDIKTIQPQSSTHCPRKKPQQ